MIIISFPDPDAATSDVSIVRSYTKLSLGLVGLGMKGAVSAQKLGCQSPKAQKTPLDCIVGIGS